MKENSTIPPTVIVIVGITGDLARRKLLPAIAGIAEEKELPDDFRLVGISRRKITPQEVLDDTPGLTTNDRAFLLKHLTMYQMDLDKLEDYVSLKGYLEQQDSEHKTASQHLFYLSIPPQFSEPIVTNLGLSGIAAVPSTKLLLEKPFGTDLASAEALIARTRMYFGEEQIYRIDHYLAKEMSQNIVTFRSQNPLFAHTWSAQFIDKIEIIASEQIGIEGRGTFYEQTGALRDFIQSHLLQLAALILMQPPQDNSSWQTSRLAALRALIVPPDADVPQIARRGQYEGYGVEAENPGSTVETFAAVTLFSDDPLWQNVPISLITGKALDQKRTEIRVFYKADAQSKTSSVTTAPTPKDDNIIGQQPNVITFHLQPNEGIDIQIWVKQPGFGRDVQLLPLAFQYSSHYQKLPEAYERVLVEAMHADHTLFSSSDEVLASWQLLAPIQHYWEMHNDDLIHYQQGTSIENILEV